MGHKSAIFVPTSKLDTNWLQYILGLSAKAHRWWIFPLALAQSLSGQQARDINLSNTSCRRPPRCPTSILLQARKKLQNVLQTSRHPELQAFTQEKSVLDSTCLRCCGSDNTSPVSESRRRVVSPGTMLMDHLLRPELRLENGANLSVSPPALTRRTPIVGSSHRACRAAVCMSPAPTSPIADATEQQAGQTHQLGRI